MSALAAFFLLLGATVTLLAAAFVAGIKAWRRAHIPLVIATVAALAATVWQAQSLSLLFDLPGAGPVYPVHKLLARLSVLALLPPVVFGVWTLLASKRRVWHGRLAWIALAFTLCSAVSGSLMLLWAPSRSPQESAASSRQTSAPSQATRSSATSGAGEAAD